MSGLDARLVAMLSDDELAEEILAVWTEIRERAMDVDPAAERMLDAASSLLVALAADDPLWRALMGEAAARWFRGRRAGADE